MPCMDQMLCSSPVTQCHASQKGNTRSSKPVFVKTGMYEAEAVEEAYGIILQPQQVFDINSYLEIVFTLKNKGLLLSTANFHSHAFSSFSQSCPPPPSPRSLPKTLRRLRDQGRLTAANIQPKLALVYVLLGAFDQRFVTADLPRAP